MFRSKAQTRPALLSKESKSFILALLIGTLLFCAIFSFTKPWLSSSIFPKSSSNDPGDCNNQVGKPFNRTLDPPEEVTFYDDSQLTYSLGSVSPIKNWDRKRKLWLKLHPTFDAGGAQNRIFIITGSQPSPCKNPIGDHLLLRCFKNKADYSRIHGYDIFYNTACLDPKLCNVWAKVALVRAAMVAHPEAEWIWWMDSDAIFTDMYFKVPLHKYKQYNLIVPGWPDMLYEKKSWVSVNTGSFLMRNCQWSLDFLDVWALMSPRSRDYKFWSETLMATLSDKAFPGADEQSSLVYILLRGEKRWKDPIHIETEYQLSAYWVGIVGNFNNYTRKYGEIQKKVPVLRRRRAEVVSLRYGSIMEEKLEDGGYGDSRRPFITHFTGCQPCSGNHDPSYVGNSCWIGMERALNFADNQVLENFGFVHTDLSNGSLVSPLAFAFPLEADSLDS